MFFTFYNFFDSLSLFFVGVSAVHAAEGCFFSVDDFLVASFVDFATTVSTHVKAGFNGNGNKIGEAFEQACADLSSFIGEFEDFLFFLAHWLDCVFRQALLFELLEKRID